MHFEGPGRIIGAFAVAGLVALAGLFVFIKSHPHPIRPQPPAYDNIFKYCTNLDMPDDSGLKDTIRDPLYARVAALAPGEYRTADDGEVFIFGSGMFQIQLPSRLQVVRSMGSDVQSRSTSDHPRSVIGCTTQALVRALKVYGLEPQSRLGDIRP